MGALSRNTKKRIRRKSLPVFPFLITKRQNALNSRSLGAYIRFPGLIFVSLIKEDDLGYYPLEEMVYAKILTIRFLLGGMKSTGTGKMKTYREMPWGEVYLRQFDGRCIKRLAFSYGNRLKDFEAVMDHIHGTKVNLWRHCL